MSSKAKLHARRRAQRFGDLDALLVEALKDQKRGEGAIKRLKGVNQAIHEQFANPDNWQQTGIVLILHVDEQTGAQTTVGTFQEFTHRRHPARKLTRITTVDSVVSLDMSLRQEVSTDPFLVRGKVDPCPPVEPSKDPLAQMAIRAYLQRTKEQSLEEFLGGDKRSKIDAAKLLNDLRKMSLEKEAA